MAPTFYPEGKKGNVLEKKLPTHRRSPEALGIEVSPEALLATWSDTNDRQPVASRMASKASWTLRTPSSESLQMASEALRMAPESLQLESKSREWRLDRRERHMNHHFRRLNRRRRHERYLILCGFCSGDIGELRRRRFLRRRAQATLIPASPSSSDVDSFVGKLRRRFRNGEWDLEMERKKRLIKIKLKIKLTKE